MTKTLLPLFPTAEAVLAEAPGKQEVPKVGKSISRVLLTKLHHESLITLFWCSAASASTHDLYAATHIKVLVILIFNSYLSSFQAYCLG